jgi:hypothetical protein
MTMNQVNQSPFNQTARQCLVQLGEEASPSFLYSLQLAIVGLERGQLVGPLSEYQSRILDQAQAMLGWDPTRVDKILHQYSLKGLEPLQAAFHLAVNLADDLSDLFPNLGPPSESQE